jgi:two-component system response regulator GlrR
MKPLSILVADDDPGLLQLMQICLANAGHTVACASTGDEALKLLNKQHFDLLVTDVLMPEGDGLNLIMDLKKAHSPVCILVISGGGRYFPAKDCVRLATGLGAHAALFKPFGPPELFEAINRALAA